MSGMNSSEPRGVLRPGWSATVGDYAIAGGWVSGGDVLVAEDGGNMELCVILPDRSVKVLLRVHGQDESEITGPAFSPDGTLIVSGDGSKKVTVWDAATGAKVREMACGGIVYSAAFSPDGA